MKTKTPLFIAMIMAILVTMAACGGSSTQQSSASAAQPPVDTQSAPKELNEMIDLSDAVAVVRAGFMRLAKITEEGKFVSFTLPNNYDQVNTVYVASDGNLYVSFVPSLYADMCVFARLSKNGDYLCISKDKSKVEAFSDGNYPMTAMVQFDASGNIYYSETNPYSSFEALPDIAKYDMASKSPVYYSNSGRFQSFLIQSDGRFFVYGYSDIVNTEYLGWYPGLSDGVEAQGDALTDDFVLSLFELPDESVYYGTYDGGMRVDADGKTSVYVGHGGTAFDFDTNPDKATYCDDAGNYERYARFCSSLGGAVSSYFKNDSDELYVIVGQDYEKSSLWQYWPDVKPIDTSVYRPSHLIGEGRVLFVSGKDKDGANILVSYDLDAKSETVIMQDKNVVLGGKSTEIKSMSYSKDKNWLLFIGKRSSSEPDVIGIYDLSNGNPPQLVDVGVGYDDFENINAF